MRRLRQILLCGLSATVAIASAVIVGTGPASAVAPTAAGAVVPVTPARIADSRTGQQITGPIAADSTATIQITGQAGVPPTGVAAAILNVTVVDPTAAGYLTVWPSGIPRTTNSNLNFTAHQNIPNTVIVPIGADGRIQIYNGSAGTTHTLVDITGYTVGGAATAAGAVVPVTPARIADSRTGQQITGPIAADSTATIQITGQAGVPPTGVAAAILNVTVVDPTAAGYLTVWPSGIPRTTNSNLNFTAHQNIPNTVIVPIGADGRIQIYNGSAGTTHTLVDITGYTVGGAATAAGAVVPVTPARIADSRTGQQITGPIAADSTATIQITGQAGVPPTGVAAAILNVTVVDPTAAGYLTVWPSGIPRTTNSNLNFTAHQNIPNTVIVPIGADGRIQIYNGSAGTTHTLVDITGYTVGEVPVAPGQVLIAGRGDPTASGNGTDLGDLSSALSSLGYDVVTSATVPQDLSGFSQMWYVDTVALTQDEQDDVAAYVAAGHGLYLNGEWACCSVNDSSIALINRLVPGASVAHGGTGSSDVTIGGAAPFGLGSTPRAVPTLHTAWPGSLSGVAAGNVVGAGSDPSRAVAAAWGPQDVTGGGRIAIVMDVNWIAEQYRADDWHEFVENLARFLG